MKSRVVLAICCAWFTAAAVLHSDTAIAAPNFHVLSSIGCQGGSDAQGHSYWLRCEQSVHGRGGGGPLGGGDGHTYQYLWLPSCPGALPGVPGSEEMNCRSAHNCADQRLLNLSLYSQLLNDEGKPLSPWRYMRSECRARNLIGPGQPRHTLNWSDIRSAIRALGIPPAEVQGPDYTLVNLRTTFYTSASTIDRTLTILGFVVDVHITPSSYSWYWGDGATTTTHTPGRPYPAKDVTHTYHHSTAAGATLPVRVDVAYQAQFRVDGGAWVSVNDQLVVAGTTRQLPVKQASAVLVPGG